METCKSEGPIDDQLHGATLFRVEYIPDHIEEIDLFLQQNGTGILYQNLETSFGCTSCEILFDCRIAT